MRGGFFCFLQSCKGTWYRIYILESSIDLFDSHYLSWSMILTDFSCMFQCSQLSLIVECCVNEKIYINGCLKENCKNTIYFFIIFCGSSWNYPCDLGTDKTIVQTWSTLYNLKLPMLQHSTIYLFDYHRCLLLYYLQ